MRLRLAQLSEDDSRMQMPHLVSSSNGSHSSRLSRSLCRPEGEAPVKRLLSRMMYNSTTEAPDHVTHLSRRATT